MIDFIDLQTNDHKVANYGGRKVSISYSSNRPETCNLLGNLPHQTEFKRKDLVRFAKEVIRVFEA